MSDFDKLSNPQLCY